MDVVIVSYYHISVSFASPSATLFNSRFTRATHRHNSFVLIWLDEVLYLFIYTYLNTRLHANVTHHVKNLLSRLLFFFQRLLSGRTPAQRHHPNTHPAPRAAARSWARVLGGGLRAALQASLFAWPVGMIHGQPPSTSFRVDSWLRGWGADKRWGQGSQSLSNQSSGFLLRLF